MRMRGKIAKFFDLSSPVVSEAPPNWKGTAWNTLDIQEKAVQWAAYYADTVKVKEYGRNAGAYVQMYLKYVGLDKGFSWCAAYVSWLLFKAGWTKFKSAAVWGWSDWATPLGRIRSEPKRGMLAIVTRGDHRHIEIVIATEGQICPTRVHESGKVPAGCVHTIGGNTSSGSKGSQSDGDGVYRRLRSLKDFDRYVMWW